MKFLVKIHRELKTNRATRLKKIASPSSRLAWEDTLEKVGCLRVKKKTESRKSGGS